MSDPKQLAQRVMARAHSYDATDKVLAEAYLSALASLENAEKALAFYAEERRYEVDEDGCAIRWEEYEGDPILHDGGEIARAAISPARPTAEEKP